MPWFSPWKSPAHGGGVTDHPYYPPGVAIPGYQANATPLFILLGSFGSSLAILVGSALTLARRGKTRLDGSDQLMLCWFVLCGSLHCFFEGYFVLNHDRLAGSQALLAQVWKEYALSDSRYLTSDPFTLCVEAVTVVVWGPLCYATAISIARGSSLRYPLQTVVSTAHLYGVALYYATCYAEKLAHDISYSRPEALYFWGYYVGMNAPWVVVPAIILYSSAKQVWRVFGAFEKINKTLRGSTASSINAEPKKTR